MHVMYVIYMRCAFRGFSMVNRWQQTDRFVHITEGRSFQPCWSPLPAQFGNNPRSFHYRLNRTCVRQSFVHLLRCWRHGLSDRVMMFDLILSRYVHCMRLHRPVNVVLLSLIGPAVYETVCHHAALHDHTACHSTRSG